MIRLEPGTLRRKREECLRVLLLVASIGPLVIARGESYNLRAVNGIEAFGGSTAAREVLGKNGFVVADPAFKQIFEAYIKSPQIEGPSAANPMWRSLPSFITTDSAWHTYHVLLEEGRPANGGSRKWQAPRLLTRTVGHRE